MSKTHNISLNDLIIAYRKAKVDAFYESGHFTALSFAEYETALLQNLKSLQTKLNAPKFEWMQSKAFVGSFSLLLKSAKEERKPSNIFFSDKDKNWGRDGVTTVDYRIIGQHSVNFHILSSLWIEKVGYNLETVVSNNSYGCRLKRKGQTQGSFVNSYNQDLSPDMSQLGHFRSYSSDYKNWQKNGILAIKETLKDEQRLIVSTFDLRRFYHRISPDFLLNDLFKGMVLERHYTPEEERITQMLVTAIRFWNDQVIDSSLIPDNFKANNHCGVPLGLGASKVIANLILAGIDKEIENNIKPVFYGRYVDDFFIVLKDKTSAIKSSDNLWKFFETRLQALHNPANAASADMIYEVPYASTSLLEFARDKEKIFILEGESADILVDKLAKDLEEHSSEWKLLPDAEDELDELSKGIVSSTSDGVDQVPNLRQSDGVSLQRLKFAFQLRDYEALVGLTPPEIWQDGLERFFKVSFGFIFSPENISIYYKYYSRLIQLAVKADKPQEILTMWHRYNNSWQTLKSRLKEKAERDRIDQCKKYGNSLLKEAIAMSLPLSSYDFYSRPEWDELFSLAETDEQHLRQISQDLFFADLHSTPFRRMFLDEPKLIHASWGLKKYDLSQFGDVANTSQLNIENRRSLIRQLLNDPIQFSSIEQQFVPNAFFFYTRPFNMLEVTMLIPEWQTTVSGSTMNSYLSLFNLPSLPISITSSEHQTTTESKLKTIELPSFWEASIDPTFALTSFETKDDSWFALITDDPNEPDNTRYKRIFGVINEVLRRKERINYLVFPELSIPRKILAYLAKKLKVKGISLIAGLEYEKMSSKALHANDLVSNQLVYILSVKAGTKHEQISIRQEKVEPAIHEKSGLRKYGRKKMRARDDHKYIIDHGGLMFSGLICNDFLNIRYRQSLTGLIDALIVVEWNKDVETYDALVQSSSNDLHCFVMQVNNRSYGDTRLRGPFKEIYKRDQVRLRGGEFDYFVLATLPINELKNFQRRRPSPKKPFKPTPTGYQMSKKRRS
jgi:hypothetical protein